MESLSVAEAVGINARHDGYFEGIEFSEPTATMRRIGFRLVEAVVP